MNWHGIASKQLPLYMKTLYMKPHRCTLGEHPVESKQEVSQLNSFGTVTEARTGRGCPT